MTKFEIYYYPAAIRSQARDLRKRSCVLDLVPLARPGNQAIRRLLGWPQACRPRSRYLRLRVGEVIRDVTSGSRRHGLQRRAHCGTTRSSRRDARGGCCSDRPLCPAVAGIALRSRYRGYRRLQPRRPVCPNHPDAFSRPRLAKV